MLRSGRSGAQATVLRSEPGTMASQRNACLHYWGRIIYVFGDWQFETRRNRGNHPMRLRGTIAALLLCLAAPAVAEEPFTPFMSEGDEARVGAEQHPQILAEFGGAYDDAALDRKSGV